jgi:hypothetical protein
MAKRKAQKRKGASSSARKRTARPAARKRTVKKKSPSRPRARAATRTSSPKRAASPARRTTKKAPRATTRPFGPPPPAGQGTRTKASRLDRVRRTLEETVPTPPSSLDMKRRGSAVRSGRAETAQNVRDHRGMSRDITAGDVDVDLEDAYFTGDEAPGGDNPTPDQDIVDDIGKALGVEYQDNEELKAVDKVTERDRNRWELDPASSEDYKDRK